ncbi:23S rRNA (uracil(1939)-C(5))-methyltransferase RlmD [Aerosticca soli]|uniref:23S rRNA (uracil(1939)-C(5))-methyltransferase RlmD n=1 Tax=Aerosticca soli TaxID=2010829 RepID=A0A2Z6E507_9GAMM|nr:23S rRNA (uracil(1939)-C(5))-methyltransferase RlmD [Aerosticca soli]BBD79821.1 23S rRNA (Uracil-5-) -methyltransferase RumA [Aerosticca soli]
MPAAHDVRITDFDHDGRGVARIDGKTVFVAGALPGEQVRLAIRRRHRHFDEAQLLEVLEPAASRVTPRCPHAGVCGGCSLQHMDAAAQIVAKQRMLADALTRIGKVTPAAWLPPLTDAVWGYRRRGRLSVRRVAKKGRVLVGFREQEQPRFVADVERCEVVHPALGAHIGELAVLVGGLEAADAIAQIEFAAGDELLALVFRHLRPLGEADRAALTAFAKARGLAVYLQPGGIDSVHPLWPQAPELSYRLPTGVEEETVTLAFEPLDFIQVNGALNRKMVAQALALLDPRPHERVLDLFCGLGNFTLPLARRVAAVAGVEGEHGLVERAMRNAARNGIENARFHVANLFEDQRHAAWAREPWDAILLDPPRAGAEQLLAYLPGRQTRRVVYVSCHPASLARDAGLLVHRHGFTLTHAGVMDMFAHTAHVEAMAVFERG